MVSAFFPHNLRNSLSSFSRMCTKIAELQPETCRKKCFLLLWLTSGYTKDLSVLCLSLSLFLTELHSQFHLLLAGKELSLCWSWGSVAVSVAHTLEFWAKLNVVGWFKSVRSTSAFLNALCGGSIWFWFDPIRVQKEIVKLGCCAAL